MGTFYQPMISTLFLNTRTYNVSAVSGACELLNADCLGSSSCYKEECTYAKSGWAVANSNAGTDVQQKLDIRTSRYNESSL